MIHLSRVLQLSEDGRTHTFKFVAKGSTSSAGGYIVEMTNAVVTSSCYKTNTRNLKSLTSGQIRKCLNILIIEFDGVEVFV